MANPDICLLQNTFVLAGSGKAVVCCVGSRTLRETEMKRDELLIEETMTDL